MLVTSWSDAEDEALQGLPVAAQVLYLRGLRRWMDFRSGLVGVHRRISWQMLTEVLYVEPARGVRGTGRVHESAVRRLAGRLEAAGLVQRRSAGPRDYLIFFLPLAITDQSAQKKADSKSTASRQLKADAQADSLKARIGAGLAGEVDSEADSKSTPPIMPKADTPPVSGNKYPPTVRARARMSTGWEPNWAHVEMHLLQLGIDPKAVSEKERAAALGELRSYWVEQEAFFTDGQWAQKLAKEIRRARGLAKTAGLSRAGSGAAGGAVDWVEVGKRYGITARAGESWDDLIKRIKAAQAKSEAGYA